MSPLRRLMRVATSLDSRRVGNAESETSPDRAWRVQVVTQCLQVEQQVLHRLIPLRAVLPQRLREDALHFRRGVRARTAPRRRLVLEDGGEHVAATRRGERAAPRDHLVEHHAERPDVRPRVHLLATRLLGRHVRGSAHHRPGVGLHASMLRGVAHPSGATGASLAKPKSSTFTTPSGRSMTFSGLMSRWTIPAACATLRAAAT